MRDRTWQGWAVLTVAVGLLATGCQQVYRSETVLNEDGGVRRALYQPAANTPPAAQRAERWKQVTHAPNPDELERQGLTGPIDQLPVRGPADTRPYFAAWGTFNTIQDLPDSVVFTAPEGSKLPDGHLVRDYQRTDYVFAIEHRWRETLTDVVTLEDMQRARGELADLLLAVASDTFTVAVGKDYDATALFKWLRSDGKTWLNELTDALFVQCAAHKGRAGQQRVGDALVAVCSRHGLELRPGGKPLDGEAQEKALDDLAVSLLERYVRRRSDGAPLDHKTAVAWWQEIKGNQEQPPLFRPAAEKVIQDMYGGKEAFQHRLGLLVVRVVGLYWASFLSQQHFHYTLTMPGEVVETNGEMLSGNRILWEFDATEAYPLGFDMVGRSLVVQPPAQKALLHGQPLADREALVRFVNLASSLEGLAEALQECRRQGTMAPLYAYRQKQNGDAFKQVNRLLQQLQLPLQAPAKE